MHIPKQYYSVSGPCLPTEVSWVGWPKVSEEFGHSLNVDVVSAAGKASKLVESALNHVAGDVWLGQGWWCVDGQAG